MSQKVAWNFEYLFGDEEYLKVEKRVRVCLVLSSDHTCVSTTEGALGYALTILSQMRANVQERFQAQTRALQTRRHEGEDIGRNPQMQNLMGRTWYLWE